MLEQTNRCDVVINGYGLTYGIFSKDVTYYWNLNGQLDVIGSKIGLAPLPDLNGARTEISAPYHLYRTLLERAASQKTHRRSGSLDKPGTARQILQSVGIC